ncbi:MAG: response regulator [Nitrospirae bacterium]|nr:response regulator [Nitrospirota bacterium]
MEPICSSGTGEHNDYVERRSRRGGDLTFGVYPSPAVAGDNIETAGERVLQDRPPTRKLKILFMEDDVLIAEDMAAALSIEGYEVTLVPNGKEAIEAYRTHKDEGTPFDLAILDLAIRGGMGGEQTMGELLRIDKAVKAIITSGYSDKPVIANYRSFGFKGLICKPYSVFDLKKEIERVMGPG